MADVAAAKADLAIKASDGGVVGGKAVVVKGVNYEVTTAFTAADVAFTDKVVGNVDAAGDTFIGQKSGQLAETVHAIKQVGQLVFTASEGMLHTAPDTDKLTSLVEAVQSRINTARVEAGSQYAALESAVNYTTDLTAQYELGYNTVNDVNFSMETAHLAKNQILQQAATAMLAQANQGQQGLLQLIT